MRENNRIRKIKRNYVFVDSFCRILLISQSKAKLLRRIFKRTGIIHRLKPFTAIASEKTPPPEFLRPKRLELGKHIIYRKMYVFKIPKAYLENEKKSIIKPLVSSFGKKLITTDSKIVTPVHMVAKIQNLVYEWMVRNQVQLRFFAKFLKFFLIMSILLLRSDYVAKRLRYYDIKKVKEKYVIIAYLFLVLIMVWLNYS